MKRVSHQRGFAYIAAVIFLIALAAFALAMLRLQNAQQVSIDGNIQGMRAGQAARGGLEWAFYQLGDGNPAACAAMNGRTLNDFAADGGFRVTLACTSFAFNEGQLAPVGANAPATRTKTIFEIQATACNGSGASCADAASVPGRDYVERKRAASICATADGDHNCY